MRGLAFFFLGFMIFGFTAFDLTNKDQRNDLTKSNNTTKKYINSGQKNNSSNLNVKKGSIKGRIGNKEITAEFMNNKIKESFYDFQRIQPRIRMLRHVEPNKNIMQTPHWEVNLKANLDSINPPQTFSGTDIYIKYGNPGRFSEPYASITRKKNTSITITHIKNRTIKGTFKGVLYNANDSIQVKKGAFHIKLIMR